MIIREIAPTEMEDLIRLYNYLYDDDLPRPDADEMKFVFRKIIENDSIICFVAEVHGKVVASCVLAIIPNLSRGCRSYAFIENVVTHKNYRRKGIGKALIKHVIEFSFRSNCYKIMLLANSDAQSAHNFYEACGFKSDSKTGFIIRNKNL